MIDPQSLPSYLQAPQVELDWVAYYERFKEIHGDPVKWRGRLLFRDGWTYSSTDYAGPEWPPPTDAIELMRMRRAYWVLRKRVILVELEQAKAMAEGLRLLQLAKSAPLQQRIQTVDENGQAVTTSIEVESRYGADRVEWLRGLLAECDRELADTKEVDDGERYDDAEVLTT